MKFSEAYEALVKGRDLMFAGEQRVSLGDKRPRHFLVFVQNGGTQGLDWLHSEAHQCELAPRALPALPDGWTWHPQGSSHPTGVVGPNGFALATALESSGALREKSKEHAETAAVYEALAMEFETR